MCAFDVARGATLAAGLAALAPTSAAADPGRLDLLAAEASRLAAAPGPVAGSSASWGILALLLLGTMAAAFAGTYLGARRVAGAGGRDGWRELTYRFRSGTPLRLKTDTLRRLSGVLGELEEIGSDLKARREGAGGNAPPASDRDDETPPAPPLEDRAPSVTFRRREPLAGPSPRPTALDRPEPRPAAATARPRERRAAYERARRLLREGADPAAVREMTGLKAAEVDLLRAAPGTGDPDATVRRRRAHLNVRFGRAAASGGEK